MWDGFFDSIFKNINTGLSGAIATLTTSPPPAPPPPQVETSQNQELVANALARIPKAVDLEIAQAINNAERDKMELFSNLIANPYDYPELSEGNKILFTQAVIEDLIRLQKPDQTNKNKDPINSIIDRISNAGNNSFIDKNEAIVISNYYVDLHQATEKQIPLETKQPSNFQCRRGDDPKNGRAGGDTTGRRSKSTPAPPPPLFPHSRRSKNRTHAQGQNTAMHSRMVVHILHTQEVATNHPASLKPITNLPINHSVQSQTRLTGRDARNQVLRNGMRPTDFKSGDAAKAKERDLENIGKKLARLEFALSQIKIRKDHLNMVRDRPQYGSHNPHRTEEYRNAGSNIQNDINTLNKSLLELYTNDEFKKVHATKRSELLKLKNTPSARPSATLVAKQVYSGYLTRQ